MQNGFYGQKYKMFGFCSYSEIYATPLNEYIEL